MDNLRKIDLNNMTWKQCFDTIEYNFNILLARTLNNEAEIKIEQFAGGNKVYKLRDIRKKVTYTNLSSAIYEFLNSTSILI